MHAQRSAQQLYFFLHGTEIASIADSSYNALEVSLKKRFSHGISFLASYTWSKAIDDASSFNMTGSAASRWRARTTWRRTHSNLAAERGLSMFDARHRFVFSYRGPSLLA